MSSQPGGHQRVPSGSTARAQHPAHHLPRSAQSALTSSPSRKDTPGDYSDSSEMSQSKAVGTPLRGGSRLRQELSTEYGGDSLSATASPQSVTPSRLMPPGESIDLLHDSPTASNISHHDLDNPPMPLPRRRVPLPHLVPSYSTATPAVAAVKRDAKPKQYSIETPSEAPRYTPGAKADAVYRDPFSRGLFSGNADFFPWNGSHHEDEWSAEAIQKGTWDRGSQNETSSARFAVMPALKQKTGLSALSTIFMGVLNQRRNSGQITAPSTFKPPPRVTVTDTKREVWLKDLANPAISLRRLSRTIPHGIRGKTLLDQCLNKNVPTERAIWLAKCVGANDIRALNRKGVNGAFAMGGELKWIRDWTVFVEQFVESVVSGFAEQDWKKRVLYATRLATVLYSEYLLDRDHYLDWMTSGLENSPQAKIPMWIIIAQICWTDLLRCRKYGRRVAFALLSHLHTIDQDPDRDIAIQLSNQLTSILCALIQNYPENFIHPTLWLKYRASLKAAVDNFDSSLQASYSELDARNRRMVVAGAAASPSGSQHLVKLLDATLRGPVDGDLAAQCWASLDNHGQVVKTVIEWATSSHRPGISKVYTASNLLRTWSLMRINLTLAILELLDDVPTGDEVRKQMMYHLVSELCRSGHFSLPQYVQWLIARGSCHDAEEIEAATGPCSSRLLVELPIHCFSEERRRDRANLLRRAANYDVIEEADDIATALRLLQHTIGFPRQAEPAEDIHKTIPLRKLLAKLKSSSMALKSAVGCELRDAMIGMDQPALENNLSLPVFVAIRSVFEAISDFSMLADALRVCTRTSSIDILAACTDIINVHLLTFAAIGAAEELFDLLLERLKVLGREQGIVARPFLASLALLAAKIPSREAVSTNLQQELANSDKNSGIDACSPVSDNMVGQGSSGEAEVSEQIDKLLASGTSVDNPTMNRLFRNIIPRLEAGWGKLDESRRVFASLLSRLRAFDSHHFDKLMADWVSHIRSLPERQPLSELFPLLLSLGCLTTASMLQTASAINLDSVNPAQSSTLYLQELLRLLIGKLPKSSPLASDETYRFQAIQASAGLEHPKLLLQLIKNAIAEYSTLKGQSPEASLPFDEKNLQHGMLTMLRLLVIVDSTSVSEALKLKDASPDGSMFVRTIVAQLLNPGEDGGGDISFEQVLGFANELTMPFCQLSLNFALSVGQMQAATGEESKQFQFDVFAKAMDSAIDAKNIMWTSMLPCLSEDITQHLKSQAYSRFFELIPSSKAEGFQQAITDEDRIQLATNLLGVIEAIISGQPPSKSGHLTSMVVDKLTDLWETLANPETDISASSTSYILQRWLPALLRFISLHSSVPEPSIVAATPTTNTTPSRPPSINFEARARTILLLCGLLFELEARYAETSSELGQQVFDVALLLVDALPDDLKAHCAKAIIAQPQPNPSRTTTSDPRMYYLFSAQPASAAENLMLAHRDKATLPHSAAARGLGAMYGIGPTTQDKFTPFTLRRWEVLSEPTPNIGENDTSLSLGLFEAIKIQ